MNIFIKIVVLAPVGKSCKTMLGSQSVNILALLGSQSVNIFLTFSLSAYHSSFCGVFFLLNQ